MPEGDLERFRQTLQRLQTLLDTGARSDRFKPSENFALARVVFGDAPGEPVTGEVVDMSADGMKLALAGGMAVQAQQLCRLQIGGDGAERFDLQGEVRWVESHPLITVIGIQLRTAIDTTG